MVNDVVRLPLLPCPYCGTPLDAVGSVDGTPTVPPDAGDFLVCFRCQEPAVYQAGPFGSWVRLPTPEELAEFAVDHGHNVTTLREFWAAEAAARQGGNPGTAPNPDP